MWLLVGLPACPPTNADTALNDSINADQVYAGGGLGLDLAGRGVVVGIWDEGPVRSTHEVFNSPGQPSRVSVQEGAGAAQHSTHVAGIVGGQAASNPGARGVADAVQILSWTAENDLSEIESAAPFLDLSNHSYGPGGLSSSYGDYSGRSRFLDQIAYDNPNYLTVWSAGNDGSGYDTLPSLGQTAKNTLVVGSVRDHTVDPHDGDSISLNGFSSRGPTDDGRIAPHVVTNGNSVTSASNSADNAYITRSGTSMAAPAAVGAAALLIEHALNLQGYKPPAATTKGLLMHTATDVTTGALHAGPDYATGYGLVNVAEGAMFLTNALSGSPLSRENFLFELDLSTGEETVFDFRAVGGEVKATLVWTDVPGTPVSGANSRAPMLVNDLDLWAESGGDVFFPWTLDVLNPSNPALRNTRNSLDNVEQVFIENLAPRSSLSFHIGHTGALTTGTQGYSLFLSGVQLVPEPSGLLLLAAGLGLTLTRRRNTPA